MAHARLACRSDECISTSIAGVHRVAAVAALGQGVAGPAAKCAPKALARNAGPDKTLGLGHYSEVPHSTQTSACYTTLS